jgi:two-component system, OmpR family, sensor histidine kinase MprB
MSLRWRIAIALAVLAAATTITVGIIGYVTTRQRLVEEVDRSLEQAMGALRLERDGRIAVPSRGLLDVYVQVLDDDGVVLDAAGDASYEPGDASEDVIGDPRRATVETVDTAFGEMRVRTQGLSSGAVQVARSLRETASVLADVRWRTMLLVVVVSAVAAALGWVLARSVTRPLVRLTRAATDVEQSGRLDVEVPVAGRDEVGQLGTAFNGMLGALAASRADQQRLVEDAGHELRTPLTSLRTNLAVLRRHPDLDPATRDQVVNDLHVETEELVGLVEEVVALARGVNDDAPERDISLGDLARAVAERAERRFGRSVTVTADDSTVRAAYPALERAVSNLVDNAAKFDRSGAPIEIEVCAGAVTVLDRGPGIPPGDDEQVFNRFYRAESARSLPGSGLGLSIVREVAERYGGSVHAGGRDGGGAAVGLRLPMSPVTSPWPTVAPVTEDAGER